MTETWTADQSMWPAHLRDNAASQQCGRCGRHTYAPAEFGAVCRMPQPDGQRCSGRFETRDDNGRPDDDQSEDRDDAALLHLYAARVGTPTPRDTVAPLHEAYAWVGVGKVRLSQPEPAFGGDLVAIAGTGTPHLTITWHVHRGGWPDTGDPLTLPIITVVGQVATDDGWAVRMVAHRAGRVEHTTRNGRAHTTIALHRSEPSGDMVTWYYRKTRPAVGETWRGYNHGSLLKVTAVDDQHVHALWMYTGNPYYADRVGTIGRFRLEGWNELCEYAPEWNEPTTRPGGA